MVPLNLAHTLHMPILFDHFTDVVVLYCCEWCASRKLKHKRFHELLLMQVGEEILVTAMHISGQWEGELKNGAKGYFPFTHIQFIDNSGDQA